MCDTMSSLSFWLQRCLNASCLKLLRSGTLAVIEGSFFQFYLRDRCQFVSMLCIDEFLCGNALHDFQTCEHD